MPAPRFELYVDEIGEALVMYLRDTIGADLGLVLYEQGTLAHLPSPALLDSNLPALFVAFERSDKFDLFMAYRFRTTYHYKIRFCRRSIEGENPTREMQRALSKIAAALAANRFALEQVDGDLGITVLKVEPSAVAVENDENSFMMHPEIRIGVGHVDVGIFVESTGF